MDIRTLLKKSILSEEEKKELVEYICEEEKKYEDINFEIINFPKEKKRFKLIRKDSPKVTLGFQKTILGFMENRYEVAINHEKISEQSNEIVSLLTTIYHELCHVKQKTKATSLKYPLLATSLISKELLVTAKHKSYYKINYECMYGEIDARMVGRDKTIRLLTIYNPELSESIKGEFKARNYVDGAYKKLYIHKSGNDIDLGEILLSQKTDKMILNNPELLDSTPSLVFEYNNNGKRKTLKHLYEMEPYYLKDKNKAQQMLISAAIDEFMFIYLMLNKEESLIQFYNECGRDGLKRLEVALRNKIKDLQARKISNKKLLDSKIIEKTDYLTNYSILNHYSEILNTYLKLIDKLYITRQTKIK